MTCVICLEETLTQSSIELPCGHAYHAVCLLNYAVRGNRLCPMCRTPYAEEADVEEPDDPLLDEWMQEQARLRERERLISHGMRLARQGKACKAVESAVHHQRELVAALASIVRERHALDRSVRAHAKHCRAAIAKLQRETSQEVSELVQVSVHVCRHSPRYWSLFSQLLDARQRIADAVEGRS